MAHYDDSARHYSILGREFSLIGDFEKAEYYFKKSLKIYQLNSNTDLKKIAASYRNLGANYYQQWKYYEALNYYNLAEDIYLNSISNSQIDLGILTTNKGALLIKSGDFHNAKFHFNIAMKYFAKETDQSVYTYTTYLLNSLGAVSIRLREYNKAISYFNECISLSLIHNTEMVPVCYGNLALLYNEMNGNEQKAEKYYLLAIDYYNKNKSPETFQLAGLYSNYADFLLRENKYYQAKEFYLKSLNVARANNYSLHPSTANTYLGIGDLYLKIRKPDSALFFYQKSISSLVPDFNAGDLYANPDADKAISKLHLLISLKHRASGYLQYFYITKNSDDLIASLGSYDLAIKVIDQIRLGYQNQESKLYLSENEKSTYSEAMYVADKFWRMTADNKYLEKAFEYAERSKSAILLAAMRDAGAKGFGGIPEDLLKKEKDLVRDIAFYKEQMYEESGKTSPDYVKLDLWEKTLFNLTNQNENLIKRFEKEYPRYHTLKYNTGVTGIDEVAKNLAKNSSMIEYMLSDSILYIFVVNRKNRTMITQQIDTLFGHSLNRLIRSLKYADLTVHTRKDYISFYNAATVLYDYLIEPVKSYLNSNHLIIIPDDMLAFLPFEVLFKGGNQGEIINADYRNLNYLVKSYSISYGYSSTMLFENQWRIKKSATDNLLAFAPVYNGNDTSMMRGNSRSIYRKNLAPIPGAKEEVEKIVKMTSGKAFVDKLATEFNFKTNASDFDILHLAMHTIIDDQNPMFSKLVFSMGQDTIEDGLLNTYEIFNMTLRARLTILSSCSSGEGLLKKGEGVVSLARGFAYAGCPGLIMTLWEMEDKTGIEMMINFYKNLKKGNSKDIALQKAKIEFIESGSQVLAHPFYWSSYICIGDQTPLFIPYRKYLLYFAVFVIVAAMAFAFFKSKLKKERRNFKIS